MKTWDELEKVANETGREWIDCRCKICNGKYGYMWFSIRPDPSIGHSLNAGITTEQMVAQWKKKQKGRTPESVD